MTKKTLPHFPFYPSDFIAKTGRLTDEQIGAYIRLLCEQWITGDIPLVITHDGTHDANVLRMICESADRSWPAIAKYFEPIDTGMKNPRMEKVRVKALDIYQKRVNAGIASGEARTHDGASVPTSEGTTQNPKLKEQKKENLKRTTQLFDRFYSAYPRKVSKSPALKAFTKLNPDDNLFDVIMVALEIHKKNWTDPQFIPHPSTWLNQRRWEDEFPVPGKEPAKKDKSHACSVCESQFEAPMTEYTEYGGMCPSCRETNNVTDAREL